MRHFRPEGIWASEEQRTNLISVGLYDGPLFFEGLGTVGGEREEVGQFSGYEFICSPLDCAWLFIWWAIVCG